MKKRYKTTHKRVPSGRWVLEAPNRVGRSLVGFGVKPLEMFRVWADCLSGYRLGEMSKLMRDEGAVFKPRIRRASRLEMQIGRRDDAQKIRYAEGGFIATLSVDQTEQMNPSN